MAVVKEREMDNIFNVIDIVNRDSLIGNHFDTAHFRMLIESMLMQSAHVHHIEL